MKTLRLFLVAALAAAFLSPLEHARPAEAQTSVLQPPVRTTDLYLQRRAISKIGSALGPALNAAWLFDDFLQNSNSASATAGWNFGVVGTGAGAQQAITDEGGGWHQLTTGATAASAAFALLNSPAARTGGTVPWYCAHRSKLTTAVTAQTKAWAGLQDASFGPTIGAGFFGNLHATNFSVQYDGNEAGSFVSLGVAADTAAHTFELWTTGDSKLHCTIDFGADLCNVTMASAPTNAMSGARYARNGIDAVARTVRIDWFACLFKRS